MRRLIGVYNHDFCKGKRVGKIHLAVGGVGKAFCGVMTQVESGGWFSKKQIAAQKDEICKVCLMHL